MASNPELVKYIADQLSGAGTVTYRKMFGEYGMYLDGKIFALICDNQLFIKITEAGKRMAPELPTAPPYTGAKDYFLFEEIDDRDFLTEFVMATCKELPTPKPKKGKGKTAESKNRQEKANPEKGKTEKKKMVFDYKKEYKEFYLPPRKPGIIDVPEMNFIAVRGQGNPNEAGGEYKTAIGLLYGIAFTIKMSYKGNHKIDGYFSYVVPPLEGLWWQTGQNGIDYAHKESFEWISMIRLPEFVTKEEFDWAVGEAAEKKQTDFSKVEFFTYHEGLCVQCMHIGSYDDEPVTLSAMDEYAMENGFAIDISNKRFHHEIYLSDPRRCAPEKLRTVIRHPVKRG